MLAGSLNVVVVAVFALLGALSALAFLLGFRSSM